MITDSGDAVCDSMIKTIATGGELARPKFDRQKGRQDITAHAGAGLSFAASRPVRLGRAGSCFNGNQLRKGVRAIAEEGKRITKSESRFKKGSGLSAA